VGGSIIDVDNRTVGEAVPLVGTPFALTYVSDRVPGHVSSYRLDIPMAASDPADVSAVQVTITVAGRTFHHQGSGVSGDVYRFVWDGRDASGHWTPGGVKASVNIGETHLSGATDYPLHWSLPVGTRNVLVDGLGGWTLSAHHFYDSATQRLHLGSGSSRAVLPDHPAPGHLGYLGWRVAAEDGAEVYLFDNTGRHLQTLHGLTGQPLLTFAYDAQGRLTAVTDADGNTTTIGRDANGQATGITGPYGHVTTLTFDEDGLLQSITTPTNDTYEMTYWSAAGLLKTFRTPRGLESTFTYDADGHLVQDANTAAFAWDLALTAETDAARQITLTSAEGRASQYDVSFPAPGAQERTVTDALGVHTRHVQTPTARELTGPLGSLHSTLSADPRFGAQAPYASAVHLMTPGGIAWSSTVEKSAALTDISCDPLGSCRSDPFSILFLKLDVTQNGNRGTVVYDGAARTATATTAEGRTAVTTIDDTGRVTAEQLGSRTPVHYTYDTRGRLSQVTQGTRTATLTYNPDGFVDTLTDPLGRTTAFQYDGAGRVTRQTLPDGRGIGFTYNTDGDLNSLTPPGRTRHRFTRRLQGDISVYQPPTLVDGEPVQTTYGYNRDRQLTRVTRPDGQAVRFRYGAATGALEALLTPQGTRTMHWHPSNGLLESVSTPDHVTVTRTYDGTLVMSEVASGLFDSRVEWTYNNDLQVAAQTVTDAIGTPSTVTYTYDRDGWLTTAGALALAWDGGRWALAHTTLGTVTSRFKYNAFGERTRETATHQGAVFYDVALARDPLGRVTTKTEVLGGVKTATSYTYDPRGRLKTVTTNGALAARYTYDANSNRTARTANGVTIPATYDAQDRLLTQGSLTFTYTPNGELLTKTDSATGQTTTYTYDVFGNLTRVDLPNGDRLEYVIDGFNRRVGKKLNGALVRQYVYQSPLQMAAELDANGDIAARYVYGARHVPEYMEKDGATYRLITDHLGSVRLVVHAQTGAIAQRLDYDEFGRVLLDTHPGFQPFGFAGGLYEPATQLVRFGARDYDPETGRWTSKDPIGFAGGDTNLYGYVVNDPVNFIDPNGKFLVSGFIGAGFGFVSAAIVAHANGQDWVKAGLIGAVTGFAAGSGGALLVAAAEAMGATFATQALSGFVGSFLASYQTNIFANIVAREKGEKVDAIDALLPATLSGLGKIGELATKLGGAIADIAIGSILLPLDIGIGDAQARQGKGTCK
jgi:RHS repeat-associated protein